LLPGGNRDDLPASMCPAFLLRQDDIALASKDIPAWPWRSAAFALETYARPGACAAAFHRIRPLHRNEIFHPAQVALAVYLRRSEIFTRNFFQELTVVPNKSDIGVSHASSVHLPS
jgi:hypothetical protein